MASKQWLASQARAQQRFVSEIVMEALDRYGEEASPPSGRAKRVAVPDGTICNIVLPVEARQQLDDVVARKNTTRSALLTEVLGQAADPCRVRHALSRDHAVSRSHHPGHRRSRGWTVKSTPQVP
jgi:hypothetical protein